MCGIVGIYQLNSEKVPFDKLKKFTDTLYHRGPDDSGYELFENGTLGLGHRRLSILDLSEAGKQPMPYLNNRYWITYNGEIFNYSEIKNNLESKGYTFKTTTDTEVILAAYIQWGKDCLQKFNGMWAFAIWDNLKKQLFISRDRFGIKPLYYHFKPQSSFVFSSETRSFKHLDEFKREIDPYKLKLANENAYSLEGLGHTIFKNIFQLLPGHYMEIDQKSSRIAQKRWFDIRDEVIPVKDNFKDQVNKFYFLFRDACKIRLQSDVPLATALSGGLDSTSVYSTVFDILKNENLNRVNENSQKAFTAIFPGLKVDEKEYSKRAVDFMKGTIFYTQQSPKLLSDLIEKETEMADYIGRPITSLSGVYAGMKNQGISVSMDGHGVDEMMYGYSDMVYDLYVNRLFELGKDPLVYSNILMDMYHVSDHFLLEKKVKKDLLEKKIRESKLSYVLKQKTKSVLGISPIVADFNPTNSLEELSDKPYDFSKFPFEEKMLYYEFFQNTLPTLLRNFDRAGMINSVEIRMPFMDYRLVSYVFSLPIQSKIGNGFTKLILRNAMKNKIDEQLRTRTYKVGIGSPIEFWLNKHLKEWVLDNLDNSLKNEIELGYKENRIDNKMALKAWNAINYKLINT